jgi:NitT/TauT family transport system permease protein
MIRAAIAPERSQESTRMLGMLSRARRQEKRRRLFWGILTPVLLFVLWEIASRAGWLDEHFFPAPSAVLVNATQFVTEPQMRADLLANLRHSGARLGIGFTLGSLAGLAIGLLMGLIPVVRYSLSAVINAAYPLPKLALYPLMIIFFGIGNASMMALVTLGVFFMVCINTVSGVTYSPAIYRDVAVAFHVPRWTRLIRITIPAAIPSVIGGLRLGFGQALIIVISTEMVGGENGVGYMIWNSWQVLNVSEMFVGLAIVGLVGWLGSMAITAIARVAVPWEND